MSNSSVKTAFIDGDASNYLVVKNHDGEESLINIDPSSCRARGADRKLRCTLDAVHKLLNISHIHRHEDVRLEAFRTK